MSIRRNFVVRSHNHCRSGKATTHSVCVVELLVTAFNVHGSVHRKNILTYIQQDATLHCLFYLETALHVLGGTTTHHQERKQLCLQHLVFAIPLMLPAAIATCILLDIYWNITCHSQLYQNIDCCTTILLWKFVSPSTIKRA